MSSSGSGEKREVGDQALGRSTEHAQWRQTEGRVLGRLVGPGHLHPIEFALKIAPQSIVVKQMIFQYNTVRA